MKYMETTNARLCPTCGLEKFFDPTQPRQTKARGFSGRTCWDCFCKARRVPDELRGTRGVMSRREAELAWRKEHETLVLAAIAKLAEQNPQSPHEVK